MKSKIAFYERLLFSYLAVYALVHIGIYIFLANFEKGWGLFIYLWVFFLHVPIFLIAAGLSFLGKKTQQSVVWTLAMIGYIFSNLWWLYMALDDANLYHFLFMLITVVPIFATARLVFLTNKESSISPKV